MTEEDELCHVGWGPGFAEGVAWGLGERGQGSVEEGEGRTGSDEGRGSVVGVEGVVEGDEMKPEAGHEEVDEEEGGDGAETHKHEHRRSPAFDPQHWQ